MSTKIYVILSSDGKSIQTYFGATDQDPAQWPGITSVQSSDQIYHDYYALMTTYGMQYGMVVPD